MRPGITGASDSSTGTPASLSSRIAWKRFDGRGVPGSIRRAMSSSAKAIEQAAEAKEIDADDRAEADYFLKAARDVVELFLHGMKTKPEADGG